MGFLTRVFGSIPVERPQDIAQAGQGKVEFIDLNTIKGHDSKFTKQAMVGDTLKAEDCSDFVISEIVSDTEMKVKAKDEDKFEKEHQYNYKILPKLDQSQVFTSVWDELNQGK